MCGGGDWIPWTRLGLLRAHSCDEGAGEVRAELSLKQHPGSPWPRAGRGGRAQRGPGGPLGPACVAGCILSLLRPPGQGGAFPDWLSLWCLRLQAGLTGPTHGTVGWCRKRYGHRQCAAPHLPGGGPSASGRSLLSSGLGLFPGAASRTLLSSLFRGRPQPATGDPGWLAVFQLHLGARLVH